MSRPRILCIEDDADVADLIVEILEEEGFEVITARDGAAGIEGLARNPDLILCDIDMPVLSGFEVLGKINADQTARAIPFIFMTALSQRKYHLQARQLGCDDYITKPLDFELLIAIIRHRLSQGDTGAPAGFALTEREHEALTWVARGKSSSEIAIILGISERTVNFHIDNVIQKTQTTTRVQAAVKCAILRLIAP